MTVARRKPVLEVPSLERRFGTLAGQIAEALCQLAETGRTDDLIAGFARTVGIERKAAARILSGQRRGTADHNSEGPSVFTGGCARPRANRFKRLAGQVRTADADL